GPALLARTAVSPLPLCDRTAASSRSRSARSFVPGRSASSGGTAVDSLELAHARRLALRRRSLQRVLLLGGARILGGPVGRAAAPQRSRASPAGTDSNRCRTAQDSFRVDGRCHDPVASRPREGGGHRRQPAPLAGPRPRRGARPIHPLFSSAATADPAAARCVGAAPTARGSVE